MDAIRGRMEGQRPGSLAEIEALTRDIIDPFRSVELELSRELQVLIGRENIRAARDEEIPAGYKEEIEEYFRRLGSAN